MAVSIVGSSGITFPDSSAQSTSATGFGFKNRIINGAMVIDQRNAGASVTLISGGTYLLDRWQAQLSQVSKFSVQQNAGSVTPPAGFVNYLGVTSLSAYSVLAGDYFFLTQKIEGLNASDLAWGTASAATVTLSFWVRSSLTGTFGGSLQNSAQTRSYPFSYTVSSANTWEQKTIVIAGDTSGSWLTTNGIGIQLNFSIGLGSTYSGTAGSWAGAAYYSATGAQSVVGTNGATFYITGVQLEKGSTATSFDYRPYGTELALCQRYYEKSFDTDTAPANGGATSLTTNAGATSTVAGNNSLYGGPVKYTVAKRATPTLTAYGNSSGYWGYLSSSASSTITWSANAVLFANQGTTGFCVAQNVTNNVYYTIFGHWTSSAEL